jgi:hypothetical protein
MARSVESVSPSPTALSVPGCMLKRFMTPPSNKTAAARGHHRFHHPEHNCSYGQAICLERRLRAGCRAIPM